MSDFDAIWILLTLGFAIIGFVAGAASTGPEEAFAAFIAVSIGMAILWGIIRLVTVSIVTLAT